jgi:DNA (cytosine-5)-methyltransferase 1
MLKVIDLFAGAGGFSTGAVQAGCEVVWAANHWKDAVHVHECNHPKTFHSCQDLQQADFTTLPQYDVLLASPSCQGHSKARGTDQPRHDAARSTAWAVVACVETTRPKAFVVENVTEFLDWELYPQWKSCMEKLGYNLAANVLNAADFGVAQSRVRVFITGSKDQPLRVKTNPFKEHIPFKDLIEEGEYKWSMVSDKAASPKRKWANGIKDHGDDFLIAYYGSERGGRSIKKPLGTITTKEKFALINRDKMRMLSLSEYKNAMGFPSDYLLPKSKSLALHMLGNAVCPPVAKEILTQMKECI